jgi:hypothetical protein
VGAGLEREECAREAEGEGDGGEGCVGFEATVGGEDGIDEGGCAGAVLGYVLRGHGWSLAIHGTYSVILWRTLRGSVQEVLDPAIDGGCFQSQ